MLGPSKGIGFEAFTKLVKKFKLVSWQGNGVIVTFNLPLQYYNVPIYAFTVETK